MGEELLTAIVNQIGAIIIAGLTAIAALIPFIWKNFLRGYLKRKLATRESHSFQIEMEFMIRFNRELMVLREKLGSSRAVIWRRQNGQYIGGAVPASTFVHFVEDVANDAPRLREEEPWPASKIADVWLKMLASDDGIYIVRKLDVNHITSASARFAMKSHGINKCVFAIIKNEYGNPVGCLTTSWRKHERVPTDAVIHEEIKKSVRSIAYILASYSLEKNKKSKRRSRKILKSEASE